MSGDNTVITVGITGLRDLKGFDIDTLRGAIRTELKGLRKGYDTARMLNSIAAGADQLCAQIALSLGYELVCPLPFKEYREDFCEESVKVYGNLLSKANDVLIVSDSADKDEAYLAAGKYIADHCDVLVAVWDGRSQDSICGTAAVIAYAKCLGKEIRIVY